jgi:hypothetical protein
MALGPNLQLQWSLDNSAGSIFSIGRGLIQAASSDNVQILALLAGECFGTTLPVTTTTRIKEEQLARQSKSQILGFIQARVGYSNGDSANVLSGSDGGIRFLYFAAILVSWSPTHVGAAVLLERLIRESSKEDQPLPTLHQLVDLLEALEPKLLQSGFVQEILGWNFCQPELGLSSKLKLNLPLVIPEIDQIKVLVDGLRYCFRIGEQSVTYVDEFHPWGDRIREMVSRETTNSSATRSEYDPERRFI